MYRVDRGNVYIELTEEMYVYDVTDSNSNNINTYDVIDIIMKKT